MYAKSLTILVIAIVISGLILIAYFWVSFFRFAIEFPVWFAIGLSVEYIYVISRVLKFAGKEPLRHIPVVNSRPLIEAFLATGIFCVWAFSCLFVAHMMYRSTIVLDFVIIALVGGILVAFNAMFVGGAIGITIKFFMAAKNSVE